MKTGCFDSQYKGERVKEFRLSDIMMPKHTMIVIHQADAAYAKQGNAEELEGGRRWGQTSRVGGTFNGRYVTT